MGLSTSCNPTGSCRPLRSTGSIRQRQGWTPGETAGDWGGNTGSTEARRAAARRGGYGEDFDVATYFLHDVPAEETLEGEAHQRDEAEIVFRDRCNFVAGDDHRDPPR